MRDSGLRARHGCSRYGNSQALYPSVCVSTVNAVAVAPRVVAFAARSSTAWGAQ